MRQSTIRPNNRFCILAGRRALLTQGCADQANERRIESDALRIYRGFHSFINRATVACSLGLNR